ncbi:1,2-diacylglycerol 3-glucosyltransferase [Chitinimonas prasina]|uniref:1,2-diacylglycerol 3-glucosyltransferase n=1 Tax=Chitinimonas prasina TaxID=1434937 RepID=A0ABQ5YF03_9NEIS|nr:glycosyltransferase [Chitinimonas prasina]GLR13057.1 1,2-diacylglycerol 3-glucosyltransferase [Chitinimonas prasina]
MRVLMVSDVYFPRVNGVSTSIQTFREALAALDVQVDLIAPAYPNELDEPGVWRVPSRYLAFDPEDRMMRRGLVRRLLPQLQAAQYDLVHIQTPFIAHYAGMALAGQLGVPVVATYHTFFEEYLHHYARLLPAVLTRALARRFSRSQCNALAGVIAPSSAMHDGLRRYGVTVPIAVIPTGIPLRQFAEGDGAGFRQQHDIAPDRELALFVGRVAHEKNIDLLLEVAARARLQRPRLLLLIAGEGPALAHLQARATQLGLGEHVRFLGYLDRAKALPDCYRAADVFVFGSTTETQGLVLLEAMAMGVPVLGIPAMGARDILGPGIGCVCTSDNADDFAAKLVALLQDPQKRQQLGMAARDYAQGWSAPATAERLLAFYRQTVLPQASALPDEAVQPQTATGR